MRFIFWIITLITFIVTPTLFMSSSAAIPLPSATEAISSTGFSFDGDQSPVNIPDEGATHTLAENVENGSSEQQGSSFPSGGISFLEDEVIHASHEHLRPSGTGALRIATDLFSDSLSKRPPQMPPESTC